MWPSARAGLPAPRAARLPTWSTPRRSAASNQDRRRAWRNISDVPAEWHARGRALGECRASYDGGPGRISRRGFDEAHEFVDAGQFIEQAPRAVRLQLLGIIAARRHRDGAHADGVRALDVVRRVADDEGVRFSHGSIPPRQFQGTDGNRGAGARVLSERSGWEKGPQTVVGQLGLGAAAGVAGEQIGADVIPLLEAF